MSSGADEPIHALSPAFAGIAKRRRFATLRPNESIVFGIGKPRSPEEHRYYLLPGMGKANRRKRGLYLRWAIGVGLFIGLLIGVILYFVQRPGPGLFP